MERVSGTSLLCLFVLLVGCQADLSPAAGTVEQAHKAIIGGESEAGFPAVGRVISTSGYCSGTLISPRIVLTAAHCVHAESPPDKFLLGPNKDEPDAILSVVDWVVHPLYGEPYTEPDLGKPHDVALLVLAEPAPVPPMKFRTTPLDCLDGTPVHYVGYGLVDSMEPGSSGNKNSVWVSLGKVVESGFWTYTLPGDPKNACPGDSGGPAFIERNGEPVVAGIMSLADLYCEWETFCVRVDVHAAWLYGQIETHDPGGLSSECGDGLCEYLENDDNCPDDCTGGEGGIGDVCGLEVDCATNLECLELNEQTVCTVWCPSPDSGVGCPCGAVCGLNPDEEAGPGGFCYAVSVTEANCGDGICGPGEDHLLCVADCVKEDCWDIESAGCCAESVVKWCEDGQLLMVYCSGEAVCGWDVELDRYSCGTSGEADPEVPNGMVCPAPGPTCGNGLCELGEVQATCPVDCLFPGFCGDGECNGNEDYNRCPDDCFSGICEVLPEMGCCDGNVAVWCFMGDLQKFSCEAHPACGWSVEDGGYHCDTAGEEDPEGVYAMSCESYLVSKCGDGTCDDDEDHWTCPEDCEPPEPGCGDGICAAGEDYATCPQDCFETGCGLIGREGCCDGEVLKWCEAGGVFMVNCEEQPACGWSVDDGYYWCGTGGEADPDGVFLKSCEDVSNPVCGDDFCSPSENIATCAEDCLDGPVIECGDGLCEGGETPENCAEDCLVESGPEPVEDVLTADLLEVSTTDVDLIATHPDVKDTRSGKKGGCSASDAAGPEAGLVVVILLLVMGVVRRRDPRFGLFIS